MARAEPKVADCTLLADVATDSPPVSGWDSCGRGAGESPAMPQVSQ